MKLPGLACSGAFRDQESSPAIGGGFRRQEDGISGDEREPLGCWLALAGSVQHVVEREGETWELVCLDQGEHGGTGL